MPNKKNYDYHYLDNFYYNGTLYLSGTKIALSDDWINTHQFNGKKPWKYVIFNSRTIDGCFFSAINIDFCSLLKLGMKFEDLKNYEHCFKISPYDLNNAIEEIIYSNALSKEQLEAVQQKLVEPQHDWDNNGLVIAWIIYIAAMVGSLIFRQFYILWIIISIIFSQVRKDMLR